MNYDDLALSLHRQYAGKITMSLRDTNELDRERLSAYYTPGVAAVSRAIADDPSLLPTYTWTNNTVAVVTDGSAVLGLGNIGPRGSMPVMEGKALLFKHFANIDCVPITIDVHSPDEIVSVVQAIAPSFGGINLEDIAAPVCFEVEERLKKLLDIPVFHDDQHGTAIVTLAGLINSMKVVKKNLSDSTIVVLGAGAAGTAIIKLLYLYAKPRIVAVDSQGIICTSRKDLNKEKQALLSYVDTDQTGTLDDAIRGADIFIGVSRPGLLTTTHIASMNKDAVIFALANPTPEIMPDIAKAAGAAIVATGRSDFTNQVNNAVAFPGIFRGALDNQISTITTQHMLAVAEAIAGLIETPTENLVIPSVLDKRLVPTIADIIR